MQQNPITTDLLAPLPPNSPLEVLLVREEALANLLTNLQGERSAYSRQLRSENATERAAAREKATQLDIQITRTRTALRSVRTQIASRVPERIVRDNAVYTAAQSRRSEPAITGDHIAAILIVFMLAVLMPLAFGFTRRMWRRAPSAPETPPDVISPRLDRLEQAVDAIAIEVERISESQRFVTKVMTERPAPARSPASAAPAEAPAEGKPILALGAGPIEPIPVAQRQTVRQSITPH